METKASTSGTPRLELQHASKSFGRVRALIDGSLTLWPGEVHALLGENGAGKSTLVKILAGVYLPDSGELRIGYSGIDKGTFEAARQAYARHFGGLEEKSTFNIFTQNVWYLGKLGEKAKGLPLKKLIDFQTSFVGAFEELLRRGAQEDEAVMRELAVRCLG